jgi:hypothetical protein
MMTFEYMTDVKRLHAILEAEKAGARVDHAAAILLAQGLAEHCPEIAVTLDRIRERMAYKAVAEYA